MAHNFLLSSPSRLDPQLFVPKDQDVGLTNASNNPPLGKFMPSATGTPFPGWTPVMSKTIDQYPNLNITPNRFGNSVGMNLTTTIGNTPAAPGGLNQVAAAAATGTSASTHFLGSMGGQYQNPGEMVDLSLTPFLNQYNQQQLQLQLQYSNSVSHAGSLGVTPFQDKSYQLVDFFMDSPIADQNGSHSGPNGSQVIISTPFRDQSESITPSKFRIGTNLIPNSVAKLLDFSNSKKSRAPMVELSRSKANSKEVMNKQKRSISQVDTPPRQAHKLLSNLKEGENKENILPIKDKSTLKDKDHGNDENDDEDHNDEDNNDDADDADDDADDADDDDDDKDNVDDEDDDYEKNNSFLQTPSKKYIPKSRVARTPKNSTGVTVVMAGNAHNLAINNFQTPKGKTTIPLSSPSTIVVNSSAKTSPTGFSSTPLQKAKSTTSTTNLNVSASPGNRRQSPTRIKIEDDIGIPMMGVFQESKKKAPINNNKQKRKGGVNKFQIIFTDVHTLMNSKNPPHIGTTNNINNNSKKSSNSNTSNSSMNPNGYRTSLSPSGKKNEKKKTKKSLNQGTFPHQGSLMMMQSQNPGYLSHLSPSMSHAILHPNSNNLMVQNADQSINTSKEISILSNANTSNLNITDHTSFDMNSLVSSIGYHSNSVQPLGNFLTASPNTLKYIQQQLQQQQQQQQQHQQFMYQQHLPLHHSTMEQAVMPPPKNAHHQTSHPQLQQGMHTLETTNMNGSMIMSTPQHSHIMNYPNYSPQKWD